MIAAHEPQRLEVNGAVWNSQKLTLDLHRGGAAGCRVLAVLKFPLGEYLAGPAVVRSTCWARFPFIDRFDSKPGDPGYRS